MSTSSGVWSALIAAVTALVVALVTQVLIGRRERRGRGDQRLTDVQDAALDLRNQLGRYGPLSRAAGGRSTADPALAEAKRQVDEAFALLGVKLTRLRNPPVREAVVVWRDSARFHYVSAEEVTTAEEVRLWDAMNAAIGAALTRP